MSRILKDKEMVYFLAELQHTPAGIRYRKAWDAQQRAHKNLLLLKGDPTTTERTLNIAKRIYIARAEQASLALGVLVTLFQWPPDAGMDQRFTYQPPAPASPRRRTAP